MARRIGRMPVVRVIVSVNVGTGAVRLDLSSRGRMRRRGTCNKDEKPKYHSE